MTRDWDVFCDICGKKFPASRATKLSAYTGKGNLLVCPDDKDEIDYGLVAYSIPKEQTPKWTRVNHTNTTISSPYVDLELMAYSYFLTASQDGIILSASQDPEVGLTVHEPI